MQTGLTYFIISRSKSYGTAGLRRFWCKGIKVAGVDSQQIHLRLVRPLAGAASRSSVWYVLYKLPISLIPFSENKIVSYFLGYLVIFVVSSGCDIGNHSKEHLNMSTLSKEKVESELDYVSEKVNELTGIQPKFFRPPFGDYNNTLLEVVEEKNMIGVQWTVDSLDWKGLSAAEILSRVNSGVKNGSIILFHNNSDNILEALPLVIANLKNQGYKMVTLSNLIYQDDFTIDGNGIQHKK